MINPNQTLKLTVKHESSINTRGSHSQNSDFLLPGAPVISQGISYNQISEEKKAQASFI